MSAIIYFQFFLNYIFPLFIFLIGWLGNIFSLIVLSNKELKKIGPKIIYQYLFIFDSIVLLYVITINLQLAYNLNVAIFYSLICKLYSYFNYPLGVLSPFLIVYISIDRYISIKYPARRFFLRKPKIQHIYFWLVFITSHLYYSPAAFFYDISSESLSNTTTSSPSCFFDNNESKILVAIMDLAFRVIIPFTMMFVLTGLLIKSIFESRNRIVENFLAEQNRTFYKEIKLSFSSILVNLIYIFTQFPTTITYYYPQYFSNDVFVLTTYIFFANYALNFYILLFTNSLFREKFLKIFKK